MAVLAQNGKATLMDVALRLDPQGKVADIAELLMQRNEILLDIPWMEGNLPTGHQGTVRTGIPQAVWRSYYQGVAPNKSQVAKVTDTCAMLEARSEVDADLADLNGNTAAFRLSESTAFTEGISQQMTQAVFYSNTATQPERILGLAPRYSSLSAANGTNVISAGGSGSDNTSIWLVVWGQDTVTGIYPKGSQAGLYHEDLGKIDAFDGNNNRFRAYADIWKWKCGLHVKDWRCAVRIANIDVSDLVGQTGTQASTAATNIIKLMIRAMARVPRVGMGTPAFYANRTIVEMLSIMALDRSQNALSIQDAAYQFGEIGVSVRELRFFGVPVRVVDQLVTTEAVVS